MRLLHPAAWIGVIFNCAAMFLVFWAFNTLDASMLAPDERQMIEGLLQELDFLRNFYFGLLAAQAVALGMLAYRVPYGLALALLSGLLMLPGSLLYMVGCALTHYQGKFANFDQAPAGFQDALFVFPAAAARPMRIFTAAALGGSVLAIAMSWMTLGPVLFGVSLAGLYFSIRARKNQALSLHRDYFTLPPALLAPRIRIHYSDVTLATLNDDESIIFDLDGPKGKARLGWSLRNVAPESRRQALEELGAALSAHGVRLE
jgi:hypothetical protein